MCYKSHYSNSHFTCKYFALMHILNVPKRNFLLDHLLLQKLTIDVINLHLHISVTKICTWKYLFKLLQKCVDINFLDYKGRKENFSHIFSVVRVNLLESVIKAVRNVRALRFGLSAGSLGSPAALLSNRCSLSCYWDRKFSNLRGCMRLSLWSTRLYLLWSAQNLKRLIMDNFRILILL